MNNSDLQRLVFLPGLFSAWDLFGKNQRNDRSRADTTELVSFIEADTESDTNEFENPGYTPIVDVEPINEVLACMVCEKYFTKEVCEQTCVSCGEEICSNCATKKNTLHYDTSLKNVVVCLKCDYGKCYAKKDELCMCLFCQPMNGHEFEPRSSFIVMDHETEVNG